MYIHFFDNYLPINHLQAVVREAEVHPVINNDAALTLSLVYSSCGLGLVIVPIFLTWFVKDNSIEMSTKMFLAGLVCAPKQ
jgi:hypothetical protein